MTATGKRRGASGAVADLEAALGHEFSDKDILLRALTHSSATQATGADNERMEFLGDRVLGLVIADELVRRFPSAREGELAPRLNRLVRRETCADVARELGLGSYLHLAPSEDAQGGREKTAILGNAMEAVIAALYIDGGLAAAEGFIRRAWEGQYAHVASVPRDAKTQAQERLHAMGLEPPVYRITDRAGTDHAPVFTVEADGGEAGKAMGEGRSRRLAEQAAAAALLEKLGPEA